MTKLKFLALQDMTKKLLSVLLFILLARYLTVEEFGKYQQIILVIGFIGTIFSAGIPIGLSYFHGQANRYKVKVSVYKRFFLTQIVLALLAVLVYLLISPYLSKSFNNNYFTDSIFIIIVIVFSNTLIAYFRNLSTVTNNLKFFFISTSTLTLFSTTVSIFVLIYTHSIILLLYVLAFFSALTLTTYIKKYLKFFQISDEKKIINKKEFNYIFAMGSVTLVSIVNVNVDQIMVSVLLPLSDYSNLRIGSFQIPFIGIITGSLLTVMVPIISRNYKEHNYEEIIKIWKISIEKATVLLIPIIIFCLIFAKEIIIDFFSDKYINAVIIFQIYMLQWLRAVVIFGGLMGAIGLEKELFKNTIVIAVLNIIVNYIAILNLGVIGAAITTTLLSYVSLLLLVKQVDLKLSKKFIEYFPFKTYIITISYSAVIAFIMYYVCGDYIDSIFSLILCAIAFYIIMIFLQMKIIYNDISIRKLKLLL